MAPVTAAVVASEGLPQSWSSEQSRPADRANEMTANGSRYRVNLEMGKFSDTV